MERRKALAVAGALTATVVAGGIAMAANVGLLSAESSDQPVGALDAQNVAELVEETPESTSTTLAPEVVVVDEYVTAPADGAAPAAPAPSDQVVTAPGPAPAYPSVVPTPTPVPAPSGSASSSSSGSAVPHYEDDDDGYEYEDHEDEDHEDEEDEHEGEEDDD